MFLPAWYYMWSNHKKNNQKITQTFIPILQESVIGSGVTGSQGRPRITLVARATKSTSRVLETKGKERDTRTLHSITWRLFSLAMIWRLKGPDTCRAWPTARHTFLILDNVSSFISCGGGQASISYQELKCEITHLIIIRRAVIVLFLWWNDYVFHITYFGEFYLICFSWVNQTRLACRELAWLACLTSLSLDTQDTFHHFILL